VIHLAQVLQAHISGSGYHIYTDRFYTSPQLDRELHEMKIHITGTVMISRKDFPSDLKKKKLQKYELCACQCDMKMMCLWFHDKRLVTMLSTFFDPQTQLITGYRKKQPVQFENSTVVLEYTKFMGGVDRAD
jgi:citrate lyase synthetase